MTVAKKGYLDLSKIQNLEKKNDLVTLKGEWAFIWNEYKNEKDLLNNNADFEMIQVPGSWNQKVIKEKKIGSTGFGTYFLQVKLPSQWTNRILSLRADYHAGAYDIFVNGILTQSVGKFGTTKETSKNVHAPSIGYIYPNSDILNIVIHESNFEHRVG
ncbi:MAG: hypothetical protein ACO1NV_01580, partial [Leptospira bouyouniensis]